MTVNNEIPISYKTVIVTDQQFIDLLPAIQLLTDSLIFIGSINHVKLTSQCRGVVQSLGFDGRGYWTHLMDIWMEISCGFGQQIPSRVIQNCCCPRTKSITVYYYTSTDFSLNKCKSILFANFYKSPIKDYMYLLAITDHFHAKKGDGLMN